VGGDLELAKPDTNVAQSVYWDQDDYVGFGSAAHSHRHGRRFWNVRTPDRYIAMVRDGTRPLGVKNPGRANPGFERDSLALRTAKGVPLEAFNSLDEVAHLVSCATDA